MKKRSAPPGPPFADLTRFGALAAKLAAMIAATLTATLTGGCGGSIPFGSTSALGAGVLGKVWHEPTFVDSDLYIPAAQSESIASGLVKDFSVASSGDTLELVGSWWDASSGAVTPFFRGYARSYTDGTGWASLGPQYGQIASGGSFGSYYTTSVTAGPGGLFMANFMGGIFGGSASFASDDNGWQHYIISVLGQDSGTARTRVTSAMDSIGRGYQFYVSGSTLYETPWALADPYGMSSGTANAVSNVAISATSAVTAQFDGKTQVCAFYETITNQLRYSCQDIACSSPFLFNSDRGTIATSGVAGHDSATDGEGNIMVVYYQNGRVYAALGMLSATGTCGGATTPTETWLGYPQALDIQGDSYTAPVANTTIWPQGTRPSVVYLGSGKYMAAWIGYNATLSTTRVYTTVYDPDNGGWQGTSDTVSPESLQSMALASQQDPPSSQDYFASTAHVQTVSLFSNGQGNAGIVLGTIVASSGSVYPETARVRSVAVNRWQTDNGWIGLKDWGPLMVAGSPTTPGSTCYNEMSGVDAVTDSGNGADCNIPPKGIMLSSGTSLVFFLAQDGYPQTKGNGNIIPGNRRLKVTEFR